MLLTQALLSQARSITNIPSVMSHSFQFGASASNRFPEPEQGSQFSRKAPEEQHKEIPAAPASKSASLGSQLQSIYAIAHKKGNKEEELEVWGCL